MLNSNKSKPDIYWYGGTLVVLGVAVTFLVYAQTIDPARSAAIGFFYALALVGIFRFINRKLSLKLTVFPGVQQWILRAVLYAIGLSAAYLLGIVFHTLVLMPLDALVDGAMNGVLKGIVYLISLPFTQDDQTQWLDERMRGIVITFFTVLFLIGLVSVVAANVELRWRKERQARALTQAELTALRAQMDPHFLFNTLNTIADHIKKDPDKAEDLLIRLSEMMRYIFRHAGAQTVLLSDELTFTRQYIDLLKARFGDRLQVSWQSDPTNDATSIPPLLLQPLIENAVRHGRQGLEGPLVLAVTIQQTDAAIIMSVSDNGVGIPNVKRDSLPIGGHALANLSERLLLYYGQQHLMSIDSEPGRGTSVTVRLPD